MRRVRTIIRSGNSWRWALALSLLTLACTIGWACTAPEGSTVTMHRLEAVPNSDLPAMEMGQRTWLEVKAYGADD